MKQIIKEIKVLHIPDGHTISDDGIMTPKYKDKGLVMSCTKRYHNCLYLLAGLSPTARNLMDYLVEIMDENNIVYNNKQIRENFITFMSTVTSVDETITKHILYKDNTVKEAFTHISKTGLLTSVMKGMFRVNPKYFFNGSDEARIGEVIKMELEFLPQGTKIKTTTIRKR